MRFLLLFCAWAAAVPAAVPPELAAALEHFRSDPPPGWSYTQTTSGEGRSMVERCDAARPEFDRWRWVSWWQPVEEVIHFKRRVYLSALMELAPLLSPVQVPPPPAWPAVRDLADRV